MDEIRAFIAVDLPESVRKNLYQVTLNIKNEIEGFRVISPENMHLTLKFLGNITVSLAQKIKDILDETAKDFKKIDMTLGQIGVFPNLSSPRIIWIAPDKGIEKIVRLKENVDSKLSSLGIAKEDRPFKAHLTLARLKPMKRKNVDFKKIIADVKIAEQQDIIIDAVHLYQSKLTPKGAIYTKLHSASLTN